MLARLVPFTCRVFDFRVIAVVAGVVLATTFCAAQARVREAGIAVGYRNHTTQDLLTTPFIYKANAFVSAVHYRSENISWMHYVGLSYSSAHVEELENQSLRDVRFNYRLGFKRIAFAPGNRLVIFPLAATNVDLHVQEPELFVEGSGALASALSFGGMALWSNGKHEIECAALIGAFGYAVRSRYANARPWSESSPGEMLSIAAMQRMEVNVSYRPVATRSFGVRCGMSLRYLRVERPRNDLSFQTLSIDVTVGLLLQTIRKNATGQI